jgi:hypothetical protein
MTLDEIKQLRGRQLFFKDEHLWLLQQIEVIESGDLSKIDRKSLIDFLRDALARDRREFASHLMALLFLLLLLKLGPEKFTEKESSEIVKQQESIRNFLRLTPSLEAEATAFMADAYGEAAYQVASDLRLPSNAVPEQSPWTFEEALAFDPPII